MDKIDSKHIESNLTSEFPSEVKDFVALLKPRVMSLVIFSGLVGLLLAPGTVNPVIGFVAILCITLGSGSSGCLNMWYERHSDALMKRTLNRPLPQKKISPETALEFGVVLAFISVFLMGFAVNFLSAFILLVAILYYVFIYTIWLKKRTPQNIVIGGAAGAFPPMIGWAAVTSSISIEPLLLFAIIFMWTPPHFWALSLYRSDDYKKAGIPMLPVVAGVEATKKQILYYSVAMLLTTLSLSVLELRGAVYTSIAIILGVYFIYLAVKLKIEKDIKTAPRLFGYSIIYLFLLLACMVLDKYLKVGI